MDDMPFYNGDLEPNRSQSVNKFVSSIQGVDGVCIVSPGYNRSIPGVLKNAIDWGSKPTDENIWRDKVVAMTGPSLAELERG
jgi:chromate reductase